MRTLCSNALHFVFINAFLTYRDKKKAWLQIENEFNTQCPSEQSRTWMQLKQKWNNIKKGVKDKTADNKSKLKGTGGGSHFENFLTSEEQEALNVMGDAATGHDNAYDDDGDGGSCK